MLKNEQLTEGVDQRINKALRLIDFNTGSRLDLQVLVSGTQSEEILSALINQGGKLNDVNKARTEAGLHALAVNKNEALILKEWIELIKEKKGVVFVILNGWNRSKSDNIINSSIDACLETIENVHFDRIKGVKNDFFFAYAQDKAIEKKVAKNEANDKKDNSKDSSTSKIGKRKETAKEKKAREDEDKSDN